MIAKQKILIVDDDENIAELISLYLMKECFDTKIVSNGEDALSAFETYQPNLVLLDLMLPGIDGYQVCRELRAKSQVPIIMLSAKGEVFDKVLGLELGADDYIMKPFDSKEMVARVRAVLRRYQPVKPEAPAAEKVKCVEYDGLTINLTNYSVLCDGQNVDMPPKELELLYFLAASPNQVFTREQLLDQIWGYEYIGDTRTVDVHIKRLREKIKDHPGWGTEHRMGNRLQIRSKITKKDGYYEKYTALNLSCCILSLGFLSIFTVSLLSNQLLLNKLEQDSSQNMYRIAKSDCDLLPALILSNDLSAWSVHSQLQAMQLYLNASVWFVKTDGTLITSAPLDGIEAPEQILEFDPAEIGNNQFISGNYHGYFEEDVITVMAPVTQDFFRAGLSF